MYVLGISAYYHDSAACLLKDGVLVAAAQEERFTRRKHDAAFPRRALDYCLREAGIKVSDLGSVAFYDKPLLKFERILETYYAVAPGGLSTFFQSIPVWMRQKLWTRRELQDELDWGGDILFPEHHLSHAASAFFPSPFEEAAVMTMDGVGEWATTSFGYGHGNQLELRGEIRFPHSTGLLYSAFTYFCGFKVNSGEYKLMGLAPYGRPTYVDKIKANLLDLKPDGSFRLNLKYFNYLTGWTMTGPAFAELFDGPARPQEGKLTQREMDLARSVQEVLEEIVLAQGRHVQQTTGSKNLVMAGGVALNCVANGRLLREGPFEKLWIQPAAGDAGGALGAAYSAWHQYHDKPRSAGPRDKQRGSLLGPAYSNDEIAAELEKFGAKSTRIDDDAKLMEEVARLLEEGNVIGLFNGRMEFGPRALGGRSIIGDPRSQDMQTRMNLRIKFRESFRPFAPSVLAEHVAEWFEMDCESPYMLLVAGVHPRLRHEVPNDKADLFGIDLLKVPRSEIQAVTHVDYSARVQTVHQADSPRYHALISAFYKRTGCPVIVNTSFNVRGEPIVCTPTDAYRCFMRTEMDYLVLENHILDRRQQPPFQEDKDWRSEFELD